MQRPETSYAQDLAALADKRPDDMLMTYLDSGEAFTNRQVYDAALLWAGALRRQGAEAGAAIAVMLPACPEAYFEWLGTAWLRALEVSINLDRRGSVLVHVLNNSRARIAVVAERYLERILEVADRLEYLQLVIVPDKPTPESSERFQVVGRTAFFADVEPASDLSPPLRSDVACVVYTSGTTGLSKGVIMPWASLAANRHSFGALTGREFRIYSAWTLYHSAGKFALAEAIRRGGSLFFRERWRTSEFWSDVRKCGATATGFLGGVSNFLMSQPPAVDDADNPITDVLMAPVIPEYQAFEARFGLRIHTGFATSEVGLPVYGPHPLPNHRTCGRLVPGYHIRLTNEHGEEVGPNVIGEAWVRSDDPDEICRGYLNAPEKTAEATALGWFHTGDGLMRDEDGNHYYLDRMKDCIRRRGENISSFEVENEVNAHPDVLESAAFEVKGEDGDGEVMIAVIRHTDSSLTALELVAFLEPRLSRFMIPRFIEFVAELPKTHTNRTRKVELRERGVTPATWDRRRDAPVASGG